MTKDELLKEAMKYVKVTWENIDNDCKLRLGARKLLMEYNNLLEAENEESLLQS